MTKITIAYAPDIKVLTMTLVSMASVLKNAAPEDEVEFVIMYADLADKYLAAFNTLQHLKPHTVKFCKINTDIFADFPLPNWVTTEAWFRVLLGDLLPNDDKVLYLDCDTIVRASLAPLFTLDLSNYDIACVEDVSKSKQKASNIQISDFYCNSGVLLLNLDRWRKDAFFTRLTNCMEHNNHISNDQDAINAAAESHKLRLHPKYDYMHVWWHANTPEYDADYAALFTQAEQDPVIVHFVGVKPIHKECRNRFTSEYQAYAALVPEYVALNNEIGIHKTGKGRPKLPWYKRLLWLETSTDKTHHYLNILGLCIRIKRA